MGNPGRIGLVAQVAGAQQLPWLPERVVRNTAGDDPILDAVSDKGEGG